MNTIQSQLQLYRGCEEAPRLSTYATLDATAYASISIGLPSSLLQGSYAPSLGAFQSKHLYIHVSAQNNGRSSNIFQPKPDNV